MKLYSVHVNRYALDPEPDIRLVREGFNWAAFVFSILWALLKGYWWVAGGIFVISVALSGLLSILGLDLFGQAVVNIGFNLLLGFWANDLARWTLSRRGFMEEEVVSGVNSDHALERYLQEVRF